MVELNRLDINAKLALLPRSEVQALRTADTDLVLRDEDFGGFMVLCDVATGARRPLVPLSWRKKVFDTVHELSHTGPRPMAKAIAKRFVLKNFKKDVHNWCQQCIACQKSKVNTHVRAPVFRRDPPDRRFGSLLVDLVSPLPASQGMKYLFTIVDRFSRWI